MTLKSIGTVVLSAMFLFMVSLAYGYEKVAEHFEDGCSMWGTPPSLAMAIAKVESDFRPWAVNIQGKSYYMNDRESALALIKKASAQQKSYDVGLMQINSYWLKKFKLNPADVLDPKINVIIGCWILSEELKRYGMTWKAIGAYHTPVAKNPDRAKAYANKVIRTWEDYK